MTRSRGGIAFGHGQPSSPKRKRGGHIAVTDTGQERGKLLQMQSRRIEGFELYVRRGPIGQRVRKCLLCTHGASCRDDLVSHAAGVLIQTQLVIFGRQISECDHPPLDITRGLESLRCLPEMPNGCGDIRIRLGQQDQRVPDAIPVGCLRAQLQRALRGCTRLFVPT